ncbi:FAD-dependent oxidoreductase [Klebsiella pneumoniae]|nr:FAD-dependent oxidoreductase [Klebsiella pneumoniae]
MNTVLNSASARQGTIDREARLVRDAEGHEIHWDKLVLATGSYPFVPPIPGNDLAGVPVHRTWTISTVSPPMPPRGEERVVIGGGLFRAGGGQRPEQLGLRRRWWSLPRT